jgi:NTP pyrophosphatase (non-canonical NTP hydrolase)
MLANLYANDDKPGWRQDDPRVLVRRLEEEVGELRLAVMKAAAIEEFADPRGRWSKQGPDGERVTFRRGAVTSIDPDLLSQIRSEAADVANFAAMVVDRCELLAAEHQHYG